eukprot:CAMPEP_0184653890 /NCGR_PEP_ID=MMETSP0308-20130426/11595_1 /TAXON_ID=38269 /ORGANISM="Gloeochaete witrockiana, Strain SAG 46.84" /LENGTH=78 /DNA_ID=CAMNT_0027089575 /DNA_START=127 /DNA_END=359 /DNA_ORIENTATION=+
MVMRSLVVTTTEWRGTKYEVRYDGEIREETLISLPLSATLTFSLVTPRVFMERMYVPIVDLHESRVYEATYGPFPWQP